MPAAHGIFGIEQYSSTGPVLEAQNAGMGIILVILDFSRAFDTLNISLLLSKLVYCDFGELTVKWFERYLSK